MALQLGPTPSSAGARAIGIVSGADAHRASAQIFPGLNDVAWTTTAVAACYWVGRAMGSMDFQRLYHRPRKGTEAAKMVAANAALLARLPKQSPTSADPILLVSATTPGSREFLWQGYEGKSDMNTKRSLTATAAGALLILPLAAVAQSDVSQQSQKSQEDRVSAILGTLFGDRVGGSASIEQQWALGRKPLATQRSQFHARIDSDVRSGALTSANGNRMKSEYDELVQLETRYGADNRFTTAERTELGDRYGALTQALSEGGYADSGGSTQLVVADGRSDFESRVNARMSARAISRSEATRLKNDYATLVQTEASYARDGISTRERDDLDARLDALDARVGDTTYGGGSTVIDNRTRLTNVERALGTSGLTSAAQAQVRVELGDLTRLEAAYGRASPTSDDRAYLERRIAELETRARVRR